MRLALVFITLGVLAGPPVMAQAPISAIGWLSESIKNPPPFRISPESPPLPPQFSAGITEKKGLMDITPDAIGLLSPAVTGFPSDMWGDMTVAQVVATVQSYRDTGLPAVRDMFHHLLLAQANPPVGDTHAGLVLQARVDRLFEIGALDAAEALVTLDQPLSRAMFDRTFDIAILTDRTLKVCEALSNAPALSNDLSQKVYCLARGGDWNAAAITLSLGASIGAIGPVREDLLMRFLDPELAAGTPDPVAPDPMLPMDFILREAVLLPRPSGPLPLAYLYRDTESYAPLRARLEASERLVKSGALPAGVLFAAYRTGQPAASGGVWGRQAAIQSLDQALDSREPDRIGAAFTQALTAMDDAGLRAAFAQEFGPRLAKLPYDPRYGAIADAVVDTVHLANLAIPEWNRHITADPRHALAGRIVAGIPLDDARNGDALVQAITASIVGTPPDTPNARRLLAMLANGNTAQALLEALQLLSAGAAADPGDIRTGLFVLIEANQTAAARRIAVQTLLLPVGEL